MLFDVFFLGLPIVCALCLGIVAAREADMRFWTCSFSFLAYCAFYLAGGREVLLYITSAFVLGGAWLGCPL
jgi:hypothetical protein